MWPPLCSTDFLAYFVPHQKQQLVASYNLFFFYIGLFSLFFLFPFFCNCFVFFLLSLFLLFFIRNLLLQIHKKIVDRKNFNVDVLSFVIWIVRDKVSGSLYHAPLTRHLAIVYIDLLTKILGGISVFLLKILNKSATHRWILGRLVKA